MHIIELTRQLEDAIHDGTLSKFPRMWDEDHITFNILSEMERILKSQVVGGWDSSFSVNWSAYKCKNKLETRVGDIAILVKIQNPGCKPVEGVAFLEAKKRDRHSTRFPEINDSQLDRVLLNSSKARYLLYDYDPITQFGKSIVNPAYVNVIGCSPCHGTHAVAVPADLVNSSGARNHNLYTFSVPFTYQLLERYFAGYDLEYSQDLINLASGYFERDQVPEFVLSAAVAVGDTIVDPIMVNRDVFGPISGFELG